MNLNTKTKFFHESTPLYLPEDVRPFLGKPDLHWKQGRSAYELAHSWINSEDLPAEVRIVLEQVPAFKGARLCRGFFEHQTRLDSEVGPSQTDLLAKFKLHDGTAVVGIEGKVDETFGPLVGEWNTGTPSRERRLSWLCDRLGVRTDGVDSLRYQLFHRTAAALIEAERLGASHAAMLVQSFSANHAHFADFQAFADFLGTPVTKPGRMSEAIGGTRVPLYLGWCTSPIRQFDS